jgi:hypothetical protein
MERMKFLKLKFTDANSLNTKSVPRTSEMELIQTQSLISIPTSTRIWPMILFISFLWCFLTEGLILIYFQNYFPNPVIYTSVVTTNNPDAYYVFNLETSDSPFCETNMHLLEIVLVIWDFRLFPGKLYVVG